MPGKRIPGRRAYTPAAKTRSLAANKRALKCDAPTLKTIHGLGMIHATHQEVSAVLGVSDSTWVQFRKDYPGAVEAYEQGRAVGKVALRRMQMRHAGKGNAQLLIWLGKNWLGQVDKQELTGPGGGPIQVMDVSALNDSQLEKLRDALTPVIEGTSRRIDGAGGDGTGPSENGG